MSDLHCRRSSGLALVLAFSFAACVPAVFAETPNPDPTPTAGAISDKPHLSPEIEGDLLMVRRSYEAAIDAYERETQPTAVLWNKIGVAYHHLFALEEARKYYQKALALKPDYSEALNNLAAVYHGQHAYRQAEKTYREALKYAPNNAITYCNLGTSYFAEERYKPGMQAYHQALQLNPHIFDPGQIQIVQETSTRRQLVAVNYYLAKTYANEGKTVEALGYLRKALEAGFRDRKLLMKDKELASLRATPEFHQLMMEQTGGE